MHPAQVNELNSLAATRLCSGKERGGGAVRIAPSYRQASQVKAVKRHQDVLSMEPVVKTVTAECRFARVRGCIH